MSEILVVDPKGDRVKIYEREYREPVPGGVLERKQVAYELISGERVQLLDENTFVSASTGARFTRVQK